MGTNLTRLRVLYTRELIDHNVCDIIIPTTMLMSMLTKMRMNPLKKLIQKYYLINTHYPVLPMITEGHDSN